MKFTLTWQDFMRQPENKALKESKGIHACKQKFIQEQNRLQWNDPMIIQEAAQDAGVVNYANAADGSSNDFITGHSTETSTFTWANPLTEGWTGSFGAGVNGNYIEFEGYNGSIDYSRDHVNSMKVMRCYMSTSSLATFTVPSHVDIVCTASVDGTAATVPTASIIEAWRDQINNMSATSVQGGFTNTIAPNTLFTASVSTNTITFTVTTLNKGSVKDISTNVATATGSVTTTAFGKDTFFSEQGAQIFNGDVGPYNALPRKQ
jgi:hypothetical protein